MANPLEDFVTKTIHSYVELGGELVSDKQYQERVEVCSGCDLSGIVQIPLLLTRLEMRGCTECGCPFATKPKAKKYFSFQKLRIIKSECPHPSGNKWAIIDNKYE